MAEAVHGEDGELMYEMEEGGMKDGSATGSSSDRDDSDELDRAHLLKHADVRAQKSRSCRRWWLVYAIVAVGFILIGLVAWKLSLGYRKHDLQMLSNGTALFAPTTIIISLDGFRADFLQRGLTPRLNAFIKEGISPLYMLPSFPSVTFPNHYTLATGLYPEAHGVVGNTFWDPDLEEDFHYTDPARSMDPKWWGGEPFWVTAEKSGVRSAIHMWPGSEAHILGVEPTFLDKFNGKEILDNKVARILEFLDKPGKEDDTALESEMRPQLIAAYVPNVDSDGHKYGPNSTEIRNTIQNVDSMLDQIFQGLEDRNLTHIVNVIVVSDHGMATTDMLRVIQLEDLIDMDKIERNDGWPLVGLRPKNPDDLQGLYDELAIKSKSAPNWDVYLRDVNMPERYHFQNNDRIAPLWIVPRTGWAVVTKDEYDVTASIEKNEQYNPRGLHGYDHEHPLMRAIFVARGPAFPHQPNSKMEPFQNVDVYNILCDSIGITPMPNNGTLRLPLKTVGLHGPDSQVDEPADPDTATSVDTTLSVGETPAVEPTKSLGVDPVTTKSIGVDPVNTESIGADPVPTQPTGDDNDDDTETLKDKFQGWWDWLSDTVEDLWDKVTGNNKSEGSD